MTDVMQKARLILVAGMSAAACVQAAEIKVLAGSAIQPVMNSIIPAFEQKSGHRVVFDYGTVGGMAQRVQRGENADLTVVAGPQMDALVQDGRVVPQTRLDLGKTGVGVFVRKGEPRPDISSVESFRRAMLDARSIGYNDPAAGAPVSIYLIGLFERLGIADRMTPKTGNGEHPDAARALLQYLSTPEIVALFRSRGFLAP